MLDYLPTRPGLRLRLKSLHAPRDSGEIPQANPLGQLRGLTIRKNGRSARHVASISLVGIQTPNAQYGTLYSTLSNSALVIASLSRARHEGKRMCPHKCGYIRLVPRFLQVVGALSEDVILRPRLTSCAAQKLG